MKLKLLFYSFDFVIVRARQSDGWSDEVGGMHVEFAQQPFALPY